MAKVLVFIDNHGTSLKKSSLELLTLGRSLGETAVALNGKLHDDVAASFAEYGVSTVLLPSAEDLDDFLVAPKAAYVAAAAEQAGASIVLLDNSPEGKEIAARAGIRLSAGVITGHRRRLDQPRRAGGADRKNRVPAALYFGGHFRSHPAESRDADGKGHCCREQGCRISGVRDRGLRHRG